MAGEAKTNAFMLGTATVMLGAQADLFDLNPTQHSIGLVKNFNLQVDQTYTELTQGVQNQIVFSVRTGNKVMGTMEAYEYTGANLAYALGQEGYRAAAAVTGSGTVMSSPAATTTAFTLTATAASLGIVVGSYVKVQTGNSDQIIIRKVSAVLGSRITVSPALPAFPAVGATVSEMNVLGLGSNSCAESTFVAAKIVGTLADCSEVVLLLPKVKVTKGFALAFNSGDFQNLPLELTVYDLLPTDPHYAAFSEFGNASAMLLTPK